METQKLTVRLPQDDLQFIKRFAHEHETTVTELIRRHLFRLRQQSETRIAPELQKITGVLPSSMSLDEDDGKAAYYEHLLEKHQ